MSTPHRQAAAADPAYANYVLGVLVLVYVFNFLDRQILSILNDHIKADLGLTDAQMGFLFGTVFAVFYALFGIPLGRLADVWDRRLLISIGLALWSVMTAVSGLARNFTQLAAARVGVGVGEASASPAAFSILSDYFPAARRATVLAIYSSGIYLGAGTGLMIGGQIVDRWDVSFAGSATPFGLRGWQVAFFVVGLPGLFLALWVRTLREPVRGSADGIATRSEPHPFREFFRELRAVIPPLTLWNLHASGGGAAVGRNLGVAAVLAVAAAVLVWVTGDAAQWTALGIGLYAAASWAQAIVLRDPPSAHLILRTPSLRWSALGFAFLAFTGYGIGYWVPPFLLRFHNATTADVGLIAGGTSAAAGWLGVTCGGVLADRWRQHSPVGRLNVGLLTAVATLPLAVWLLTTPSLALAYLLNFPVTMFSSMWIGAGASTVQDLVLPRMRAVASAAYLLVITFIGLALGPYTIGKLSVLLGSLRWGMLIGLVANLIALAMFLLARPHLAHDEATMRQRVTAAGEKS